MPAQRPALAVVVAAVIAIKRAQGLTLIELLIAVSVFAVLSALAYSGLNNVLLTSSHAQAQADRLASLQMAMRYLQRDVDQIVDRRIRDQYGDQRPALESAEASEEEPLVSFTRAGWANPAGQPRSELQRVAYDYDEKNERLLRLTWPMLDGAHEDTTLQTKLLESVTGFELRYMDDRRQWQTSWPPLLQNPGNQGVLPRAVEITLTAEPWGEMRRVMLLPQ